jgi:hypothetical protein
MNFCRDNEGGSCVRSRHASGSLFRSNIGDGCGPDARGTPKRSGRRDIAYRQRPPAADRRRFGWLIRSTASSRQGATDATRSPSRPAPPNPRTASAFSEAATAGSAQTGPSCASPSVRAPAALVNPDCGSSTRPESTTLGNAGGASGADRAFSEIAGIGCRLATEHDFRSCGSSPNKSSWNRPPPSR